MVVLSSTLYAHEIPIGTEIGPIGFMTIGGNDFIHQNQQGMMDDSAGYRYLVEGGFDYDWIAVYHDRGSGYGNYQWIRQLIEDHAPIKAYIGPNKYESGVWPMVYPTLAWKSEQTFNRILYPSIKPCNRQETFVSMIHH